MSTSSSSKNGGSLLGKAKPAEAKSAKATGDGWKSKPSATPKGKRVTAPADEADADQSAEPAQQEKQAAEELAESDAADEQPAATSKKQATKRKKTAEPVEEQDEKAGGGEEEAEAAAPASKRKKQKADSATTAEPSENAAEDATEADEPAKSTSKAKGKQKKAASEEAAEPMEDVAEADESVKPAKSSKSKGQGKSKPVASVEDAAEDASPRKESRRVARKREMMSHMTWLNRHDVNSYADMDARAYQLVCLWETRVENEDDDEAVPDFEDETTFFPERILSQRYNRKKKTIEYEVEWWVPKALQTEGDRTWEPEANLVGSEQMLADWKREYAKRESSKAAGGRADADDFKTAGQAAAPAAAAADGDQEEEEDEPKPTASNTGRRIGK